MAGFRKQPQYAAPLDPAHKLYKDIVFAYSAGRGLHDGRHGPGSITGKMTFGAGPNGLNVQPYDGSSYAGFADNPDYNVLGDVTVIALITTGGLTVQQGLVTKCQTSGGSNTPWAFLIAAGGNLSFNRANSAGFRVWGSAAQLSAGQTAVVAVTQVADMSVAPRFYLNGGLDTGSAVNYYAGSGTGAPTSNTTSVKIGNRTDLASRYWGVLYDAIVIKRALSAAEIAEVSSNIWAVWKAQPRRWWGAASGITLAVANSSAANSSSEAAIAQAHAINGDDYAQSNTTGIPQIAQDHALAIADIAQPSTASAGTISAELALAAAPCDQANASLTGFISQTYALAGANIAQYSALDAGGISIGLALAGAPCDQANASLTSSVTQTHALAVTASAQPCSSAAVAVTQVHILAGTNPAQSNFGGTASIMLSTGSLAAATLIQANLCGSGVISLVGATPDQFLNSLVFSVAAKKPGVPAGTPAWLKTFLEIIAGRRGNKITVPRLETLTFSQTPAKAECEALYSYVNSVRASLVDLIDRLDG